MRKEIKEKRMWEKLLQVNRYCAWRCQNGTCLIKTGTNKNGLFKVVQCRLPCSHIDLGLWIKAGEEKLEQRKKHR